MIDEWVDVTDDLPIIERGKSQVSVDVIAKTDNSEEIRAYYAHDSHEWYRADTSKRIKGNIVAWKSLEDVT